MIAVGHILLSGLRTLLSPGGRVTLLLSPFTVGQVFECDFFISLKIFFRFRVHVEKPRYYFKNV